MDRRAFVVSTLAGVIGFGRICHGQSKPRALDLADLAEKRSLTLFNRSASPLVEGNRKGVRLSAAEGEGVVFVPGTELANGTIEFEVRGKDIPQGSFVGVAFHGIDSTAYDAIYFRPFNFNASDPSSRDHAVQYHSVPAYTWQKLRAEQPGKYEHAVNPVPDPNAWFHVRVAIATPTVRVFVADAQEACLSVALLSSRGMGLVGLWTGNGSGGDFANLTIAPA
jgi:hypothetical protein